MSCLLDRSFPRTLDSWVQAFIEARASTDDPGNDAPRRPPARIEAWLFEGPAARRRAERQLAAAGVQARLYSAYKPLVHAFLEDVDLTGLTHAEITYPVHPAAHPARFLREAYPLAALLGNAALTFTPGGTDLHYRVALRHADGRTCAFNVFAPNALGTDAVGETRLTPTGWIRAYNARGERLTDAARSTDLQDAFDALTLAVRQHPWGAHEPFFERLVVHMAWPAEEVALPPGAPSDEVISLTEALHEDIYFSLLEIFQRHSGRVLGDRGLRPGQIVPDVRITDGGPLHVNVAMAPFAEHDATVARGSAPAAGSTSAGERATTVGAASARGSSFADMPPELPLSDVAAPLSEARIIDEMTALGGQVFHAATRQGRVVHGAYFAGPGPAVLISAAQHANESSGIVGALRAVQAWGITGLPLARQAGGRAAAQRKDAGARPHPPHVALIALENPDGYALYAALRAVHPRHMHHAARYGAWGDDLAYRTGPPWLESAARHEALTLSGAKLHVNLHGYPAHEWTRPMSGYLPRGFESWSMPRGFFLVMRYHAGWENQARALVDGVTARLAGLPGLLDFNARQLALFGAHGGAHDFERINGLPVMMAEDNREAAPLSLITEFPDETLVGDAFVFAHTVQCETVLAACHTYENMQAQP